MKKNQFFTRCYACYSDQWKCKKKRISRIQKKRLKKLLMSPIASLIFDGWWIGDTCHIRDSFNMLKSLFNKFSDDKQNVIISIAADYKEYSGEAIYISSNGRLCWYWENDDDYGGSSGIMPFCYNKVTAGETWAYSEVHDLIHCIYKGHLDKLPESVQSDKQLLNFIKNNPIPADWKD